MLKLAWISGASCLGADELTVQLTSSKITVMAVSLWVAISVGVTAPPFAVSSEWEFALTPQRDPRKELPS